MNKNSLKPILSLIFIIAAIGIIVTRSQSSKESELQFTVNNILSQYTASALSSDQAKAIQEAFRKAELRGSPELDEAIKAAGFDPEQFKQPPPSAAEQQGNKAPPEKQETPGKIFDSLATHYGPDNFKVYSSAVNDNNELLQNYKCEIKNDSIEKSIPVRWENVPTGTQSLAVVMYHYPHAEDHAFANSYLLLWGIDPDITEIPYGLADKGDWFMGSNKDGDAISYTSPCSHGPGSHTYTIAVFALAETPETLPQKSTVDVDFVTFMTAIEKTKILGKAELSFVDKREES